MEQVWEQAYDKSWDQIVEDEDGIRLDSVVSADLEPKAAVSGVARGLLRFAVLVVDLSESMKAQDYVPSRLVVLNRVLNSFIALFFDKNPLSKLSIVIARDGVAVSITGFSSDPLEQCKILEENMFASGNISLANSLLASHALLQSIPEFGTREVFVVFGSLSTNDMDNIFAVEKKLVETVLLRERERFHGGFQNIRVSFVCISPALSVCASIASTTSGSISTGTDQTHFEKLLLAHCSPPPTLEKERETHLPKQYIRVGCPEKVISCPPTFCGCHKEPRTSGYVCPQCVTFVCGLPCECPVCGLQLLASAHLARNHQLLTPIAPFEKLPEEPAPEKLACPYCGRSVKSNASKRVCQRCKTVCCDECDVFLHSSLNNCPGCLLPKTEVT